jgi:chromodomain-helicase-DNA-binding protein 7
MLHFLNPEEFTDAEEFKSEYGDLKTKEQVDKLQASLRPYMLRYAFPLTSLTHSRSRP